MFFFFLIAVTPQVLPLFLSRLLPFDLMPVTIYIIISKLEGTKAV